MNETRLCALEQLKAFLDGTEGLQFDRSSAPPPARDRVLSEIVAWMQCNGIRGLCGIHFPVFRYAPYGLRLLMPSYIVDTIRANLPSFGVAMINR